MASVAAIVNADDLGMSREVNDATFELIARGRISSATIMANAPATRDAARRAPALPRCSFGVHLNLTRFEPLTGGPAGRLLVDERGQMTRANRTALPKPALLRAAYRELCAQVERVAALGVRITHLDSHHHVHTLPVFFPVLKAVQRRYGIRRVRLAKNFYAPDEPCPAPLAWKKRAYNRALQWVYATATTDAFTEFLTYCDADIASRRSIGLVELMVHPGAVSAAREIAVLESDWTARPGCRVRLVSYADLPPGRRRPVRGVPLRRGLRPCA